MTEITSETGTSPRNTQLRFIVIGAGMAGILAAIRLHERGFDNIAIYEKATRVGGTWRENTYPGIACDVPSHVYSYSFAPNPDWSYRFAPGAEIQAYFEAVARRHGITTRVQFQREVVACTYEQGRWRIALDNGATDTGDVIIAATGVLHHPQLPHFEGLQSFSGAAFHSARWDHGVELAGRRVGIIGTGSSAVQIVSAIARQVGELALFQRTPQWIMPIENPPYSDADKDEFRRNPAAIDDVCRRVRRAFVDGFANILGDADSPMLLGLHDACVANLEHSVRDPQLREKLRPDYRAGCKRLVLSDGFYDAVQLPQVRVVTQRIDRVEPAGVRTDDGVLHPLDVLVLATGFRVDRFLRPIAVTGRDGLTLDEAWGETPTAYMSVAIPGFPNLFMLNGPNSPVGNFPLIDVAEMQCDYMLQLIERAFATGHPAIEVSAQAMAQFNTERREAARSTIWNTGCRSWYIAADGLPMAWPWPFDRFRAEMAHPRFADYGLPAARGS